MIKPSEFKKSINEFNKNIEDINNLLESLEKEIVLLEKDSDDRNELYNKRKEFLIQKTNLKNVYFSQPEISLHAKVRYLERIKNFEFKFNGNRGDREIFIVNYAKDHLGYDDDKFVEELLNDDIIKIVNSIGNCDIPVNNSHKLIIKENVVVSVTPFTKKFIKKENKISSKKSTVDYKIKKNLTF